MLETTQTLLGGYSMAHHHDPGSIHPFRGEQQSTHSQALQRMTPHEWVCWIPGTAHRAAQREWERVCDTPLPARKTTPAEAVRQHIPRTGATGYCWQGSATLWGRTYATQRRAPLSNNHTHTQGKGNMQRSLSTATHTHTHTYRHATVAPAPS